MDKYESDDQDSVELDYDNDYNQSELENEENIRRIIQLCKQKYPELKYKITKCVKTIFKEKFRLAYKRTEEKLKLNKTAALAAKSSHMGNNLFKTQDLLKTKSNDSTNQIKSSSSSSPSSSAQPTSSSSSSSSSSSASLSPSLKHSISNHFSNDLKSKKFKVSNGSDLKNDDFKSLHSNKVEFEI